MYDEIYVRNDKVVRLPQCYFSFDVLLSIGPLTSSSLLTEAF